MCHTRLDRASYNLSADIASVSRPQSIQINFIFTVLKIMQFHLSAQLSPSHLLGNHCMIFQRNVFEAMLFHQQR